MFSASVPRAQFAQRYWLCCPRCGTQADETAGFTTCARGASLEFRYDYDQVARGLNVHLLKSAPMRATKYLALYPLSNLRRVVSLDEGGTPLYRCHKLADALGVRNLWLKFEGTNPTGGFKDRGSMVEVSKALETGAKTIACASTGNMAASLSAYAAVAGLPCYVLVPEGTPSGKMAQTLAFGSRVVQVRGSYDDAVRLTCALSKEDGFFLAGDYALRLEGQKSQAYEMVEQLGWRSPDRVVVPVGNGTNACAVWKGFQEFQTLGLVETMPKLTGVQPESVNPVVRAFEQGAPVLKLLRPHTVASAVCVGNPSDAEALLAAVRQSGGNMGAASDAEILEAQTLLARTEAVFVEPAAALSLAAFAKMVSDGRVGADEEVVLLLTGSGLKDPAAALSVLACPPCVEPDVEEVKRLLDFDYYRIRTQKRGTASDWSLDLLPTAAVLAERIHHEFDVSLDASDLDAVLRRVAEFLEKGKSLRREDLQLIVEQCLQRGRTTHQALDVVDFSVQTRQHEKPRAEATVRFDGQVLSKVAQGVGPVDAVINAVRLAVQGRMDFELTDYRVGINTRNTDATVDVRMTLMDAAGNKVTTMGTSPDIIVASVRAFQDAYNLLYARQSRGDGR